jgi:hypothetical protein
MVRKIGIAWSGSAAKYETTLHQLSPYIGKIKSTMARELIIRFTKRHDVVYDPFSGCGTIALEAWIANRATVANDLSPYAYLLTRAKLFPFRSLRAAHNALVLADAAVREKYVQIYPDVIPSWVRSFFHPRTLREIITWAKVLRGSKQTFLFGCLLGILHHQRPGFLSHPSSHAVPYLRNKKFPRAQFPDLYKYRPVRPRLEAKLNRAYARVPRLDRNADRACYRRNAASFLPRRRVDIIITSPPYMRQLDYGRDNRLRLWLLGIKDADKLDECITPSEEQFIELMTTCLANWKKILKRQSYCILVVGDTKSHVYGERLSDVISNLAVDAVGGTATNESS